MSVSAETRRDVVALCCAVSAGVHAGLVGPHGAETRASGLGFAAAAFALAVVAAAVARWPRRRAPLVAAAGTLASALAAYAAATTTGVPVLHPEPEPVGELALATKAVEAIGLLGAATLLRSPGAAPRSGAAPVPLLALVSVFAALMALAVSSGHSAHTVAG